MTKLFISFLIIVASFLKGYSFNEKLFTVESPTPLGCNRPYNMIHFGIGVQKSLYLEFGISRTKHLNLFNNSNASTLFCSTEWIPSMNIKKEHHIFGFKAGYKISLFYRILVILEPAFLTDGRKYDLPITPKIGLFFGYFSVLYGYNISTFGNPFSKIGNHQFSIQFYLPTNFIRRYR